LPVDPEDVAAAALQSHLPHQHLEGDHDVG